MNDQNNARKLIAKGVMVYNTMPVLSYSDPDFNLGARINTDEPISCTSSDIDVAINGMVHITGVDTAVIAASVSDNLNKPAKKLGKTRLPDRSAQQRVTKVFI